MTAYNQQIPFLFGFVGYYFWVGNDRSWEGTSLYVLLHGKHRGNRNSRVLYVWQVTSVYAAIRLFHLANGNFPFTVRWQDAQRAASKESGAIFGTQTYRAPSCIPAEWKALAINRLVIWWSNFPNTGTLMLIIMMINIIADLWVSYVVIWGQRKSLHRLYGIWWFVWESFLGQNVLEAILLFDYSNWVDNNNIFIAESQNLTTTWDMMINSEYFLCNP